MKSTLFTYFSELNSNFIKLISNNILTSYISNKQNVRKKIMNNLILLLIKKQKIIKKQFFIKLKSNNNDILNTSKEISNDFSELINNDNQNNINKINNFKFNGAKNKDSSKIIPLQNSYSFSFSLSQEKNLLNDVFANENKYKNNSKKKGNHCYNGLFNENSLKNNKDLIFQNNLKNKKIPNEDKYKNKHSNKAKNVIFHKNKNTYNLMKKKSSENIVLEINNFINKVKNSQSKNRTISEPKKSNNKNMKLNEESLNKKFRKIGLIKTTNEKSDNEVKFHFINKLKKNRTYVIQKNTNNNKSYKNMNNNLVSSSSNGNISLKKSDYEKSITTINDFNIKRKLKFKNC
jgi:hypothetical protein